MRLAIGRVCAWALAVALGSIASPAFGQDHPVAPTYASVYEISPVPGQALDFEEALKGHVQWAKRQDSGLDWTTYEIVAGNRVGNYFVMSGNQSWEAYDGNVAFEAKARARWRAEVSRHVQSVKGGIYRLMSDFSRIPEDAHTYPFATVSFFSMRPTSARHFRRTLRQVTDAMKTQAAAPPVLWFQQERGGEQGTHLSLNPFRKWTDWPNRASSQAMSKAVTPEESELIVGELAKVILREETGVIALRPGLSLH